jgi:DNA-binding NarL/FixJ family response regulator
MRVLIADDHPLYRDALRLQVQRLFPEAFIVEAASFGEVVQIGNGSSTPFDLFLLDYHMPGMSHEALKQLAAAFPESPIAVVSGTANAADVRAVIQAGARGFIPKTATGTHLLHALQLLLAGGTSVPADFLFGEAPLATPVAAEETAPWVAALTSREREVLRGVMRGLSNKQIGRELDLAEVTVKLHLRTIFRKIGARTRSEAAVLATKASLV